jgi:hypothetical protein
MKIGPEGELKKVEENAKRGEDARQMLPPALLPAMIMACGLMPILDTFALHY